MMEVADINRFMVQFGLGERSMEYIMKKKDFPSGFENANKIIDNLEKVYISEPLCFDVNKSHRLREVELIGIREGLATIVVNDIITVIDSEKLLIERN